MKKAAKLRAGRPPSAKPLSVRCDTGASPLNRLLMLTPLSASSPRPSDIRDSMSAASLGLLDTTSLPASFSNHRKAGTPRLLPCNRPAWLAGVVGGTCACQGVRRWLPARIQRLRVGRLPETTAHCSSGAASPSIWTMTTPGSSWCGIRPWWENISSWLRNSVSSPADTNQLIAMVMIAAIQEAAKAGQKPSTWMSGVTTKARYRIAARANKPTTSTPTQPNARASACRAGRRPAVRIAASTTASTTSHSAEADSPGTTLIVTISARELISTAATVAATRCRFQPCRVNRAQPLPRSSRVRLAPGCRPAHPARVPSAGSCSGCTGMGPLCRTGMSDGRAASRTPFRGTRAGGTGAGVTVSTAKYFGASAGGAPPVETVTPRQGRPG